MDTVERRLVRDIIHQQYAHGSPIVSYKVNAKTQ